jgi:2,3-bisphosphoglycerate-independent phosphoglycerate mutase
MILDGWGYRAERENNAIALAHTPCWDRLWKSDPHALIDTSGEAVGLPEGRWHSVGHEWGG